jgi:hypothetical protein
MVQLAEAGDPDDDPWIGCVDDPWVGCVDDPWVGCDEDPPQAVTDNASNSMNVAASFWFRIA